MDKNLQEAINDFILKRINYYESTAPDSVNQPTTIIAYCLERLSDTLNKEQKDYLRQLDNAIGEQCGSDRFYFYKAGFEDALFVLLREFDNCE